VVILQYKASFASDRLGLCFHFGYIYACVAVFLCCYRFLVNKILDVDEILQHNIHWPHSQRKNFKFLKSSLKFEKSQYLSNSLTDLYENWQLSAKWVF